jgi:hypothetical protein
LQKAFKEGYFIRKSWVRNNETDQKKLGKLLLIAGNNKALLFKRSISKWSKGNTMTIKITDINHGMAGIFSKKTQFLKP